MANYVEQIRVGKGDAYQVRDPDAQEKIANIWDVIYPVGSIYMSVNNTDPSYLFGGTWQRIKDTFLLASGDKYAGGSVGGEAEHTLTTGEMPSHTHQGLLAHVPDVGPVSIDYQLHGEPRREDKTGAVNFILEQNWWNIETNSAGKGYPHNNMPPYLAVYVWNRIA